LGFTAMMLSPYAGTGSLGLAFPESIVAYAVIFICGFVSLLYGAGLILIDNDLWG